MHGNCSFLDKRLFCILIFTPILFSTWSVIAGQMYDMGCIGFMGQFPVHGFILKSKIGMLIAQKK